MDIQKAFGLEKMSSMQIEAFLDREYKSPGGIDKFAQVLASVIYEDLLYEGRIRQVFDTYELSPGEEAVFDGDVRVPATALSVEGIPERVEVKSDRIRIDTSVTAAYAIVRWNEANYRKFDIVKRAHERAKSSLMEQEDTKGISVLDLASTLYHAELTTTVANKLTLEAIAEGKALIKQARVIAKFLLIAPYREKDLLLMTTAAGYPIYVPTTQEAKLKKGEIGEVFGLVVIETDRCDLYKVYVLGEKEYVGKLAVRTEVDTKTMPSLPDFGDLILFWIDEGFVCRYSKGVLRIKIPVTLP
jgi:hypothetical protein